MTSVGTSDSKDFDGDDDERFPPPRSWSITKNGATKALTVSTNESAVAWKEPLILTPSPSPVAPSVGGAFWGPESDGREPLILTPSSSYQRPTLTFSDATTHTHAAATPPTSRRVVSYEDDDDSSDSDDTSDDGLLGARPMTPALEAALPDEQDRKRVLGCLAAVAARRRDDDDDGSPARERRFAFCRRFLRVSAAALYLDRSHADALTPLSREGTSSDDALRPFLESLAPGAGLPCVALLLASLRGYDARARHALKTLAVHVLRREGSSDARAAVDRFHGLEAYVARRLVEHRAAVDEDGSPPETPPEDDDARRRRDRRRRSDAVVRGVKIASMSALASAVFAVTGGLAAPNIAAGLAAVAGSAAAAAALATTSTVSVLFGVGGGGLAAYKIHRRTRGLTELVFRREHGPTSTVDLHCVVCLSGWLRDVQDFQRPWGVTPSKPSLSELEKLQRFYAKVSPERVNTSAKVLSRWKGEERELYRVLRSKYGVDPENLWEGENVRYRLDEADEARTVKILEALGVTIPNKTVREIRLEQARNRDDAERPTTDESPTPFSDHDPDRRPTPAAVVPRTPSPFATSELTVCDILRSNLADTPAFDRSTTPSDHATTLVKKPIPSDDVVRPPWSFHHSYPGELYTVRWESLLLLELCDSVTDMAVDFVGNATKEILKHSALSALISAVSLPIALMNAANMIDGAWTLAVERSEEAGVELADILVSRGAGRRPVTLVGFSMGARAVYACLKRLVVLQEEWEASGGCSDDGRREPASVVEDAVVMGLPNHVSPASWRAIRGVVAGRLVNCYSTRDWIVGLMFQYKRPAGLGRAACGTSPVDVAGVENRDVTDLVRSHGDYCVVVEDVLRTIGFGLPRDAAHDGDEKERTDERRNRDDDEADECGSNVELSSVVADIVSRPSPAIAFDVR